MTLAASDPVTFVSARDHGLDGQTSILWVMGELDDFNVAAFEAELERLVSTNRSLIVELSSCTFMSSCTLNALARLCCRLPELTIGLVTSSAHFAKLLRIAGLESLLPRFETVADALAGEPRAGAVLDGGTVVTRRPARAAHNRRELSLVHEH